jgi:hypothetical protein
VFCLSKSFLIVFCTYLFENVVYIYSNHILFLYFNCFTLVLCIYSCSLYMYIYEIYKNTIHIFYEEVEEFEDEEIKVLYMKNRVPF